MFETHLPNAKMNPMVGIRKKVTKKQKSDQVIGSHHLLNSPMVEGHDSPLSSGHGNSPSQKGHVRSQKCKQTPSDNSEHVEPKKWWFLSL